LNRNKFLRVKRKEKEAEFKKNNFFHNANIYLVIT